MFKELRGMIDDLNSSNSNNDKIEKLKKYDNLKKIINYTYDPMKQFYVTSKNIKKYSREHETEVNKYSDIYLLLDDLISRKITGHSALAAVNSFIVTNEKHEDLIYCIIDKNLKIRMSDSTINKVFPNLIPEFKVPLADKYNADRPPDFLKEDWFASRKIDGVRCLSVVKNNSEDVKFYSRTGKEFTTLEKVGEEIKKELKGFIDFNFVLDGEMCIVDKNGDEDFTSIIKLIRKKDFIIENPKYKIFDIIPLDDFLAKKGNTTFVDRYHKYIDIKPTEILDPVTQTKIQDITHLNEMMATATKNGWEGLILRKDSIYEGKRSKNMLKMKEFYEAEYEVLEMASGPFRVIDEKTGLEVEEDMLSSVTIEHKGFRVNVGSGFSIADRRAFHKDNSLIIGKIINVKYFEESKDSNGNLSLRFPTIKCIYGDLREL